MTEPCKASASTRSFADPNKAFTSEKTRSLAADVQVCAKTMRAALAQLEIDGLLTYESAHAQLVLALKISSFTRRSSKHCSNGDLSPPTELAGAVATI